MTVPVPPDGRYLREFDSRALPDETTDVLVLGGGVAGLQAALAAADAGARVTVLQKGAVADSNTAWAQGGIAASIGDDDEPGEHAADTEATACGLADAAVVQAVTAAAPAAIEELVRRGARFDVDDEGVIALGREGGHGRRRIVHADGDATGREVMRTLSAAAAAHDRITTAHGFLADLLTIDGACEGVLMRRADNTLSVLRAGATVLATGGAARVYRESSNAAGATGDGIAAAYRAGAMVRDLEFVQFHPTTLYLAGSPRVLVTEAVRGEGAHLVDDSGARFLADLHPDAELAPRDFVSRAIVRHLARDGVRGVFLDFRHLDAARITRRFPGLQTICAQHGLDLARDPVPVRPAAHYTIGGVATGIDGRTSLPRLFAAGEVACSGLHGANRLASNSLLEGLVLGVAAGRAAAGDRTAPSGGAIAHRTARDPSLPAPDLLDLRKALASRMWRRAGIVRDGAGLRETARNIESWRGFLSTAPPDGDDSMELENLLLLGALIAAPAILREESRGTHTRQDHPDRDDERFRGSFHWQSGSDATFVAAGTNTRG